jgi:hypothetical protein
MGLFAILRFALSFLHVLFAGYCLYRVARVLVYAAAQWRRKKQRRFMLCQNCGKPFVARMF